MRHLLLNAVVALSLLAAATLPATACINDREVESQEREFKSDYLKEPTPSPATEPVPSSTGDLVKTWIPSGVGLALLGGAVVVGIVRVRRSE